LASVPVAVTSPVLPPAKLAVVPSNLARSTPSASTTTVESVTPALAPVSLRTWASTVTSVILFFASTFAG
jgi:hypothetical protein